MEKIPNKKLKEYQQKHAQLRSNERLGLDFTKKDYDYIKYLVNDGVINPIRCVFNSYGRLYFHYHVDYYNIDIIYDHFNDTVVTFLKPKKNRKKKARVMNDKRMNKAETKKYKRDLMKTLIEEYETEIRKYL